MTADPANRARTRRPPTPATPRRVARALLARAAGGDLQAFRALRSRLELPGEHAGPAKSERDSLQWVDPPRIGSIHDRKGGTPWPEPPP